MFHDDSQDGHRFLCLHGQGGTGKSVMLKKVDAYVRAQNEIVAMCAATNLAALAFKHCTTAHSLLGYPVIEDYDINDAMTQVPCKPSKERLELLLATRVIIWEEFFLNHHDMLDASVSLLEENKRLIIVVAGDGRQCPPVVPFGSAKETILASMSSSPHWPKFKIKFLQHNMRLTALQQQANPSAADLETIAKQNNYREVLNAVGENLPSNAVVVISETATPLEINTVLQLEGIKHVSNTEADIQQTIQFLYPDGLPSEDEYRNNRELPSKMILCFQNVEYTKGGFC